MEFFINVINNSSGIVGAGHFRYVDDSFGYSSAVLYYDGDEDDYEGNLLFNHFYLNNCQIYTTYFKD